MKVKYKALLIGSLSALVLIVLTYFIFNFTYFGYIHKQQEEEINRKFEVIDFVINNEKENLKSTLMDWAYWDDTYEFINNSNAEYIQSNLQDSTLKTLNLKMMIYLNAEGDIIYNKTLQMDQGILEDLTDLIVRLDIKDENVGLHLINDKVFMIASAYVTDSGNELQSNGNLIFVREINEGLLGYIQNVANIKIDFGAYDSSYELSEDIQITEMNHEFVEAYRAMKDINGNPSILVSIVRELSNYKAISYYFNIFMMCFLVSIGVLILFMSIILNKYILNRLFLVDTFMNTVAASKDTTLSLKMSGSDEFYKLAESINKMLMELNTAYKDMKKKDFMFRHIMEATNDGYLDFYVKKKEVYISSEWKSLVGYTQEDGNKLYHDFISKIHPDCLESLKSKYYKVINGEVEYFAVEYRVIRGSGEIMWVQQRGKIAEKDEQSKPIRVISTLANITARKNYEEEILFLSYSDKLTGLKNRAYMEKQLELLDEDEKSRYSIIMGDLNGLKTVNDSIGHVEGDKLICAVSNVIKELCGANDIVSRWGGDEFIILIMNQDNAYVADLVNKIKEAVGQISEFHFKISIALGYAEKGEYGLSSEFVMSLAEKRMYRNKLMENNSSRNATISSLLRTLHEKHSETEEHTLRIKNLSLRLGKRLGLSQDKLDEIELLSLLHDIGKIGIPEQILLKPSSLTSEEWEIMKSHTEIGYRIAKSTPELSHIAFEILSHHERYDGTGYPNGLNREEIPILARIINVIDSFDVMTHKREYKDAMNVECAFEELKRCSGSQFDPFIAEEFIRLLKENMELLETDIYIA
ncbi:MAG: domain S-box/diguanylate cyclase protein [Clostridia bacterium]|jgi:diguanylate cyclase (GGDEF)-like protein/PAS domain S-box-containing protein|nr:domain S-box/diguanylate cyclase protein [Clostridia bacterium]